jgi:uncharacterized membrane protein
MAAGGKGPGDFGSPGGGQFGFGAATPPPPPGGGASNWSPGDAISYGWNKVKADPVGIILPLFLVSLLNGLPNGIIGAIGGQIAGNDASPVVVLALQLTSFAVSLVVGSFLAGGLFTFLFKVARGQPYAVSDVFSGGQYFGPMFVTNLLLQIGVGIGFVLCIVPGVILALGWAAAIPLVVDRGISGVDALKESWRLTTGQKANLFVYYLLSVLVAIAGFAACCVGIFVATPIIAVGFTYVYLSITGQKVV